MLPCCESPTDIALLNPSSRLILGSCSAVAGSYLARIARFASLLVPVVVYAMDAVTADMAVVSEACTLMLREGLVTEVE